MQDRTALRADLAVQGSGLVLAVAGAIILLVVSARLADKMAVAAIAVYGATLLAMFVCSILNAAILHPRVNAWCKAFDHSAIYALIAGTYTPFALLAVGGRQGWILLAVIWIAAAAGMAARFVFHRWLAQARITLYVLMGWAGLGVAPAMLEHLSGAGIALIVIGGIIYTAGAPLHRLAGLRYHAALWHGCVLAAAGCHYAAVALALEGYSP